MKLLLVSDLHAQSRTLEYIKKILEEVKPGGVVVSGDLTSNGKTDFLEVLFEILKKSNLPAFIICGNAEQGDAIDYIDSSEYSINQKCKSFKNIKICGICDHEEFPEISSEINNSIFVTHRPPLSRDLNSKLQNKPKYHISGHIHSRAYFKKYENITHIQVPSLQLGRFGILDVGQDKVNFFDLVSGKI